LQLLPELLALLAGVHQFLGDHDPHQALLLVHAPDVGELAVALVGGKLQEVRQRDHVVVPGFRRRLAELLGEAAFGEGEVGEGHGQFHLLLLPSSSLYSRV
jgi:hypothetical protein